MYKYDCGQKVEDLVSGFKGVITTKAENISGCIQYIVTARADKNKEPETRWIDEERIKVIGGTILVNKRKTGGIQQHPRRSENPKS